MTRLIAFLVSLLPSADLPLPVRFYMGAVFIVACWVLISTAVFLWPIVRRDLIAFCRELFRSEPAKVVDINERRRRLELEAASGRRAS